MESSKSKDYHRGKKVGVYLPEELYFKLKDYCNTSGESMTSIVIESLEHFVDVIQGI